MNRRRIHALDSLHASGIILLANTHGRHLGEPDDTTLFEELDRRKAVVIHPSKLAGPQAPDVTAFAADFLLDTSRAAYRLVRNGFIRKYTDLKIILSHAGGFVPYASYRMARAIAMETMRPLEDVLDDFRSFYFDTALSSSPAALPSLMAFVKPGHALFGSDWPFAPSSGVGLFAGMLDAYAGLDDATHAAINRGSAAEAMIDDGLLDIVALRTFPPSAVAQVVAELLAGHGDGDYVERMRVPWMEVVAPAPIPVNLDGEPLNGTTFRFECVPGCVSMVLPTDCPCLTHMPNAHA